MCVGLPALLPTCLPTYLPSSLPACLCPRVCVSVCHFVSILRCSGTTPQPCDRQDQDAGLDAVKHSPAKAYSAMLREGRRVNFAALRGEVEVAEEAFRPSCMLLSGPATTTPCLYVLIAYACSHVLAMCVCVWQCLYSVRYVRYVGGYACESVCMYVREINKYEV